jgi:hypothetical protein
MRRIYLALSLVCLLWSGAGAARAGLYNTAENSEEVLSPDYRKFELTLDKFKLVSDTPFRRRTELINKLAFRNMAELTDDERLNLSAYLIRKSQPGEAIEVLRPAETPDQRNFLIFANLGTAWQNLGPDDPGNMRKAADYLQKGLDKWPAKFDLLDEQQRKYFLSIGWSEGQLAWYHKVEKYHLRLVDLRTDGGDTYATMTRLLSKTGKPIQFIGDRGQWEPGKIARAEKEKLPQNSIEIVEQLLIWMPHDRRLFWLLGELLNAQGDYTQTDRIFAWLAQNGETAKELKDHRRTLLEYMQQRAKTNQGPENTLPSTPPSEQKNKPSAARPDETPGWNPNPWQMFGVGSLVGVLVTLFASWQIRSLRRR